MKGLKIVVLVLLIVALSLSVALAMKDQPSLENGKALFNDPRLGTNGQTCNACHPNGDNLKQAGTKKEWRAGGKTHTTLESAINTCIEMAIKGKKVEKNSATMKSLVMYINSLGGSAAPAKKKKVVDGC